MALLLHYTGQDYISRGLLNTELTPGSTSAIVGGCKTGKGFAFDGTANSALDVNNIGIPMPTEFTVSCWVKVNDIVGGKTIWTNGGLSNSGFLIDIQSTNIRIVSYNTSNVAYLIETGSGFAETNKWYHIVAGVRDNKTFLYIDKTFIGETIIPGTIRPEFEPIIGLRTGRRNPMYGQICNFKYYDHALSTKEIREDYKSLILHYPLNKAITDTVLDVSGFQRHITNLTNNTVTLDSNSQVYSASLKNDGTQALVGTSDLTDLNGLNELSISFWVYKTNANTEAILTNRTIVGKGISIFIFNTQIHVDISSRNVYSYTLPLNEWVNICITQSATEQKLYANGVLVSTMTPSSLSGIGNYTSISNSNVSGGEIQRKLNGNVQDIRFYATALTEDDVKNLYNTRHSIDKNGNYYTYELIEGQTRVGMKKNGQTKCDEIIENEDGSFSIKSDTTIKVNNIKEI